MLRQLFFVFGSSNRQPPPLAARTSTFFTCTHLLLSNPVEPTARVGHGQFRPDRRDSGSGDEYSARHGVGQDWHSFDEKPGQGGSSAHAATAYRVDPDPPHGGNPRVSGAYTETGWNDFLGITVGIVWNFISFSYNGRQVTRYHTWNSVRHPFPNGD